MRNAYVCERSARRQDDEDRTEASHHSLFFCQQPILGQPIFRYKRACTRRDACCAKRNASKPGQIEPISAAIPSRTRWLRRDRDADDRATRDARCRDWRTQQDGLSEAIPIVRRMNSGFSFDIKSDGYRFAQPILLC